LMAQDYTGISYSNYDYQDNIYIVSNVKPTTPPSAPADLMANPSANGIGLNWSKNSEGNVVGYRVYRSPDNTTFTLLNTTLLATPGYQDVAAPAGATSYYRVTAVDANGGESPFASANAFRPTSGGVTINAPSGLKITSSSTTEVDLAWTDNSNNET